MEFKVGVQVKLATKRLAKFLGENVVLTVTHILVGKSILIVSTLYFGFSQVKLSFSKKCFWVFSLPDMGKVQ